MVGLREGEFGGKGVCGVGRNKPTQTSFDGEVGGSMDPFQA